MSIRVAAALSAVLLLAGCSSLPGWKNLTEFSLHDSDEDDAAPRTVAQATPVGPAAAPGAPDPFCASVAKQDAEGGDFDAATQQRIAQRSYQQCVTMYRTP